MQRSHTSSFDRLARQIYMSNSLNKQIHFVLLFLSIDVDSLFFSSFLFISFDLFFCFFSCFFRFCVYRMSFHYVSSFCAGLVDLCMLATFADYTGVAKEVAVYKSMWPTFQVNEFIYIISRFFFFCNSLSVSVPGSDGQVFLCCLVLF